MKRHWMPLYIDDYRGATARLSTVEHGAYLLLIMEYWRADGLPDDDKQLSRIAGLSLAQWKKMRPTIQSLFNDGWKHTRIDKEIAKANKIAESTSERGKKAAAARWAYEYDAPNNASSMPDGVLADAHPQPPPPLPRSIKKLGEGLGEEVKKRKAPRHGAVGKNHIWISAASQDWELYAADFRAAHGENPEPDDRGGRWFKVSGESASRVA